MTTEKNIIIIIPIYKEILRDDEAVALEHNLNVLKKYPIIFLKPKGVNTDILKKKYPQVGEVEVSQEWLGTKRGIAGYNEMMMSADFYNLFINYEFLLICQTDVWVFRDDLQTWCNKGIDHVAAPWPNRPLYKHFPFKQYLQLKVLLKPSHKILHCQMFDRIGNGGFCLRRVKVFRDLCLKYAKEIEFYNSQTDPLHNEDIFWALVPKELKLPTIKEATAFSFDRKLQLCYKINNNQLPMAAHGYNRKHRIVFWQQFMPKEAFGTKLQS